MNQPSIFQSVIDQPTNTATKTNQRTNQGNSTQLNSIFPPPNQLQPTQQTNQLADQPTSQPSNKPTNKPIKQPTSQATIDLKHQATADSTDHAQPVLAATGYRPPN
jgi:hypothetical protein